MCIADTPLTFQVHIMKYYFNYSVVVIKICETICFSKVEYLA